MSFGTISLSPDDKPDGFVLLSMYEKLESENAKLRKLVQYIYDECYGDDWFNEQAELLGFEQNF